MACRFPAALCRAVFLLSGIVAVARGDFPLVAAGQATPLHLAADDYAGVLRAAGDLQADIARVSGVRPALLKAAPAGGNAPAVLIGTVGHSALIDGLVRAGKLDVSAIQGRWEASLRAVVADPAPGVARALVIAGSDKRGTIYGVYGLSEEIGVSPWYWWADVPVVHRDAVAVSEQRRVDPGPAVRYRGLFLNDEEPSLAGWAREKFGGFNHRFYERLFELMLRLRANYLWPAMWHSAFNEDDPLNPQLADAYGIVMGTSHHEPMMRAQQEWIRHGVGPWNYVDNAPVLQKFWTEGIRRNRRFENVVTLGMRGNGDLPMAEGANVALLERIVADQRRILAENVQPDVTRIPQLWALYKEVQEYYEKGMRVPDDVTLLWCDDNWGNLRRLPTAAERRRPGGAGIYYHFDYVGGPRSYKWLNTYPISKIAEQMRLAGEFGADRIWIVNVGDLKPMEYPLDFFLQYAWNPNAWPLARLGEFSRQWATRQFGPDHADEIAALLEAQGKFAGRRKPESLSAGTYSLVNYDEAGDVVAAYNALARRAEALAAQLPAAQRDAFFELVLYPIRACATVNDLWVTAGFNRLYAVQGRGATNALFDRAGALFAEDGALAQQYNRTLAGGKWDHMMDQTHLSYTYWQQPVADTLPAVTRIRLSAEARLGVAVEGDARAWPTDDPFQAAPALPPLNPYDGRSRTIAVFNRGRAPFRFRARANRPWLRVVPAEGEVTGEVAMRVSADWASVPPGLSRAEVTITGAGSKPVPVAVALDRRGPPPDQLEGFVETGGCVSIEAEHATRVVDQPPLRWEVLPDFGRTLSGVTALPATAPRQTPGPRDARREYRLFLTTAGEVKVNLYFAPTLDFQPGRAFSAALSFDDDPPVVVPLETAAPANWDRAVMDSVRLVTVRRTVAAPGYHVLKYWCVDPPVVLEKIVVDTGGARPSYLGPPESPRR